MGICSFILDVVFDFHVKACTFLNVYCLEKGKRRNEQVHQHPEVDTFSKLDSGWRARDPKLRTKTS